MTLISTHDVFHVNGLKTRLLHAIAAKVGHWREAQNRRRSLAALSKLETWQLHDTGFTRAEIDWALELPLYVNAAHAVGLRAAQRRADETAAMQRETSERAAAYRAHHSLQAPRGLHIHH